MRVTRVNHKRTSATIECVVTGVATQVYIDRVRFLNKPNTEGMIKHWEQILREDLRHFQPLKELKQQQKASSDIACVRKTVGQNPRATFDQNEELTEEFPASQQPLIIIDDDESLDELEDTPVLTVRDVPNLPCPATVSLISDQPLQRPPSLTDFGFYLRW